MNKHFTKLLAGLLCFGLLTAPAAHAAFSYSKLRKASAGQDAGPQAWIYEDTGTALATIVAANYLIPTAGTSEDQRLEAGDIVYVVGSDAVAFETVATVTSTTGITLTAMSGTAATPSACIESTVTFDPAVTTYGSRELKSVTATGAALGDTCLTSAPYDLSGATATCYVSAADTAKILVEAPSTRLNGSASWNPSNVDDGDFVSTDITVTGAALADPCEVTLSIDTADLQLTGSVTTANVCTATLSNSTGAAVDLGAATVTAAVQDVSASAVNLASGTWKVRTCSAP